MEVNVAHQVGNNVEDGLTRSVRGWSLHMIVDQVLLTNPTARSGRASNTAMAGSYAEDVQTDQWSGKYIDAITGTSFLDNPAQAPSKK